MKAFPISGMYTFKQFSHFAPRTWRGIISGLLAKEGSNNARVALYRALPVSLSVNAVPQLLRKSWYDLVWQSKQFYSRDVTPTPRGVMPTPEIPTPIPRRAPSPHLYGTPLPNSLVL
jgi:hypothetical protein